MNAGIYERRRRDVEAARQHASGSATHPRGNQARGRFRPMTADEVFARRQADVEAARKREVSE